MLPLISWYYRWSTIFKGAMLILIRRVGWGRFHWLSICLLLPPNTSKLHECSCCKLCLSRVVSHCQLLSRLSLEPAQDGLGGDVGLLLILEIEIESNKRLSSQGGAANNSNAK